MGQLDACLGWFFRIVGRLRDLIMEGDQGTHDGRDAFVLYRISAESEGK